MMNPIRFSRILLAVTAMLCTSISSAVAQETQPRTLNNASGTATEASAEAAIPVSENEPAIAALPPEPEPAPDLRDIMRDNSKDVVQSASHRLQPASHVQQPTYIITEEDIARHGWRTLAEILRHVPEIHTITSESQFQSVSMRGMSGIDMNNSRILWMVDDVPINNIHNSGIWLDDTWSVEFIRRIEIVVGPAASIYGNGASQGVIHIYTKNANDIDKYGDYKIAIQDHQTFKASAAYGYEAENGFSILGHIGFGSTQGPGLIADSVYNNYVMSEARASVSNAQQPTSFRNERIENGSSKLWYDIDLKLGYKGFDFKIGYKDIYGHADGSEINSYLGSYDVTKTDSVDITGNSSIVNDKTTPLVNPYEFNRRSLIAKASYNHAFGSLVDLSTSLSYQLGQFAHKNYHGLSTDNLIDKNRALNKEYDITEHTIRLNVQTDWHIGKSNTLTAGVAADYMHLSDDMIAPDTSVSYLTPSVFIRDEQRLWKDRIILSAGYRFDAFQATEDLSADSSAHLSFTGIWTSWLTTRVFYGFATHQPSIHQQNLAMDDQVGPIYLNQQPFKKETTHQVDLAFLFTPTEHFHINLDGFVSLFDHASGRYPFPAKQKYDLQSNGGYIAGGTLGLDASIANAWQLAASYHFLYSKLDSFEVENVSDSVKTLHYTYSSFPEDTRHQIKLSTSYTNDYVRTGVAMFILVDAPKTLSGFSWKNDIYSIPTYAVLQPHVSVSLPANLGVMLQGSYAFSENMLDSPTYRYYYEREGVPVSRYSVMLSLLYPFAKNK